MKHFGVGNGTLTRWLRGIEPPGWTRRPNAKDDVRNEAVELRRQGWTMPAMAEKFGVSKSTIYNWTKHIPLDPTVQAAQERRSRHSRTVAEARWEPLRRERDAARAVVNAAEAAWVGSLSDREVLLLGAIAYWCEGEKAKPWRPNACRVKFINSDPGLVALFLRFVELVGVDRRELRYRLSIHESADVAAATRWWADVASVPPEAFQRPTLKRHNPTTVRHNVGEPYRGCLVIEVLKSTRLYWKIEGVVRGITGVDTIPAGGTV
jgi:hypothetical protein